MMASRTELSIVIPIYRESDFLERSLRRLVADLETHRLDYEIILVEQLSDQATLQVTCELVAQFPRVRLPFPDFGLAMRCGMAAAMGYIIVNFDIDYWDVTFARMCRCERAGFRLLELPVTVAEQRVPRSSIFGRLPRAAWSMLELYVILLRESPSRSSPHGAIVARPEQAEHVQAPEATYV